MRRRWAGAAAAVACGAALLLFGGVQPAAGSDPALAVSGLRVVPGQVEFYLAARDLPAGAAFGKAEVSVTVNDTALPAHATAVGADSKAPTRSALLLVDVSGSMRGAPLASAKHAALAYLNEVPPDVRVGVIAVSSKPETVIAPTTNHTAIATAINALKSGGHTSLYDSVDKAVSALSSGTGDDRRILLLTDGSDSSSTTSLKAATAAAAAAGIPVDTVGFRTNKSAQAVLKELASGTGGRVYTAADDSSLASAFQAAAGWFTTQLDVTADVPASLSGASDRMTIVATIGSTSVRTSTPVRFAIDPTVAVPHTIVPAGTSPTVIYIGLGAIIFAALVLIGLVVFAPLIDYTRHRRRVAQVDQYGFAPPPAQPADPSTGRSLTDAALAATEQVVRARGMESAMTIKLDRAGMRLRPHEWLLIRAALTVIPLLLFSILANIIVGVIMALLVGIIGPPLYQQFRINSRSNSFAAQLPDALQLVIGSLRSGFSLSQAVSAMAAEVADPLATEFNRALAEARLGADLEDALARVAARVGSQDLKWVVVAIRVQREVGGNLAEVLTRTVETMREREAIRGQVRALAAEGKLSAYVLVGLPIIIGGYMFAVRRDYIRALYTEPLGIAMLLIGVVLVIIGAFWMSRAVKVEV